MQQSQLLIPTIKEVPADAEVASHRLMLRAGLLRQVASGLYTWLPLGLRVVRKIEAIIREEMDRSGAQEVSMPVVQPAELWRETGRWEKMGPELARLRDRHEREFCLGPTHEEIIHRPVSPRSPQLPATALQLLPDSNQVPGRGAAPLRGDAGAGVRDEGRLLLRRRSSLL